MSEIEKLRQQYKHALWWLNYLKNLPMPYYSIFDIRAIAHAERTVEDLENKLCNN